METSIYFWIALAAFLALAALALVRERRALRRDNLDNVSLVPWPLVLVVSMMAAAISLVLALKASL